jgi:hypothetical protein
LREHGIARARFELDGDLRAWAWNLGRVAIEPGVRVEWMTEP